MLIEVFKSKIHRVKVTESDLNYIGSITIDEDLIDAAGLIVGEKVSIVNVNNGERFDTYVIKGRRQSGEICLNGPAARKVHKGDIIIIIAYGLMTPEEAKDFQPKIVFPNEETNLIN
jgi:aspartate 1-decarboxylase